MQIDRLAIAGISLTVTAAIAVFVVLGTRGPSHVLNPNPPDPAASERGAQLLNPHCRNLPAPDFERRTGRSWVNSTMPPTAMPSRSHPV